MEHAKGSLAIFSADERKLHSSRPTSINNDILALVFYFLSSSDKNSKPEDWDWVAVRLVCRQWHAVAENTPRIWSYIYRWHDLKRIEMFLRLSKNADLTVDLLMKNTDPDSDDGRTLKHNVGVILKQLYRISFLCIPMHEAWQDDFSPMLQGSAPRLRHIHLYSLGRTKGGVYPFPDTKNVMRSVLLNHVQLSSGISSLKGLSQLHLDSYGLSESFSLSDIISALQGCPGLTSLLIRTTYITQPNANSVSETTIRLPFLRSLGIMISEFSPSYPLLRSIIAPNLSCWRFTCSRALTADEMNKLDVLSSLSTSFHLTRAAPVKYRVFVGNLLFAQFNDVRNWNFDSPEDLKCMALKLRYGRGVDKESIYQSLKRIFGKGQSLSSL